jgi:serine acetyltransferase
VTASTGTTPALTALRADIRANAGSPKSIVALALFRLAQATGRRLGTRNPITVVLGVAYRLVVDWILSIDIPTRTRIGPGLKIFHGFGVVIHDAAVLEANVTLHQNVTIGVARSQGPAPRIRTGAWLGPGAIVLGDIEVGEGAMVGAGVVLTRSLPAGHRVTVNQPEPREIAARPAQEHA